MPQGVIQPSNYTGQGTHSVSQILSSYVFNVGLHKPEHSNILSYMYPQYYATALLDRLGASEGTAQDVFSWNVMERTRRGSTVVNLDSAVGSATINIRTDYDWSGGLNGYLIVGDTIRFESGVIGRVTATQESGATDKQQVTLVKTTGGNWTADDVAVDDVFGHVGTLFGEGSSAPNGRVYLPQEEYNNMSILRRSFKITGSEFTNRTYIGDGSSWYFTIEDIEMKEFARDRELTIMFGQRNDTGVKSCRGILEYALDGGQVATYNSTTGITERDLQDQVEDLLVEGVSNDIYVLCSASALADIQRALRDYTVGGGTYGEMTAGLKFQSYDFMGKRLHFAYYELFDDEHVVPTPQSGSASSSKIDFKNFTLWLDLGTDTNGRSLITLKHKELDGQSRKFIHSYEVGMMNPSGMNGGLVSNGDDAFTIHYLSEISVEVRLPNRLGILRASS